MQPAIVNQYGHPFEPEVKRAGTINLEPTFFSVLGSAQAAVSIADIEKQPYVYHAWTHACAWVIARNISYLPLVMLDRKTHEPVDDKHGLINLFSRPNPVMSRTTFMQTIILGLIMADAQRSTGGQVFIVPRVADTKNHDKGKFPLHTGKREIPDVLLPYTTKYFTPITKTVATTDNLQADMSQQLQELVGWKFMVPGSPSSAVCYLPDELIRIFLLNPYEWLKGASSHTAARIAIMQDVKSDIYNNSFFDNNATPAGILSSEQIITREQRHETIKSWNEEYGGASNTGKLAILGKGLRYEKIALSQQDMQFIETKRFSLEQILASFGLNKVAVGLYEDVNYATIVEARRWLWQDTYIPLAMTIIEAINSQWIWWLDEKVELAFDTSSIESLQLNYKDRIAAAAQMVTQMGVPPTMAMRVNGVPYTANDIEKFPWLDQLFVPSIPAMVQVTSSTAGVAEAQKSAKSIIAVTRDSKDVFSLEYIERVLSPEEPGFIKKLQRFFTSQGQAMFDNVQAWLRKKAESYLGLSVNDVLLNLAGEDEALKKVFSPIVQYQLKRSEAQLDKELGGLVRWKVTDKTIDKYIAQRKKEIHSINSTTMDRVGNRIENTMKKMRADGATVNELAQAIREDILHGVEIRQGQAQMIARTELGIVTSTSRFEAMRVEGVQTHEWITAADERVRDTHLQAEEAGPILIGQPFPGCNLLYPLQMGGAPEEVINCRCVAVAVDMQEEEE